MQRVQGQGGAHYRVDSDHQGIVRHPQVLQALQDLLG
jgi:hypothetical protein